MLAGQPPAARNENVRLSIFPRTSRCRIFGPICVTYRIGSLLLSGRCVYLFRSSRESALLECSRSSCEEGCVSEGGAESQPNTIKHSVKYGGPTLQPIHLYPLLRAFFFIEREFHARRVEKPQCNFPALLSLPDARVINCCAKTFRLI